MIRTDLARVLAIAGGLLVAGAAQAQGAGTGADRPKPAGNPGSWITVADYPLSALQAHQQGTAEFMLDIDATGVPAHCAIVGTSGVPALDEATCAAMMARARFQPVKPGAESHYRSRVVWNLPPVPLDNKGRPELAVSFEFDHRPIRCSVTPRGKRVYLPADFCKQMGGALHRGHALIGDPVYITIDMAEQVLRRRL